jgi:uroporphyrinogen decarboxylase
MHSRERVITAFRRRAPDRTPFDFALGFSPYQLEQFKARTGQDDPDEYFGTDARGAHLDPTRAQADFSRYHRDLPPNARVDEWGIGHIPTASEDPYHAHLEGFAYPMLGLTTVREMQDYPLPDIEAEYRYVDFACKVRSIQSRGLAAIGHMAVTIFEVAWYLRSMELLLMDFVDDHDVAAALLDRITAKRCIQAMRYAEIGPDVIMLGDDVGTQRAMLLRPALWRQWLKPRLAAVIAAIRRARPEQIVAYHSDGNMAAIVPDLIEIGVDVLNPVQPECIDPFALKHEYGDRLAFWGTLGTQTTFPFGSPDDVRRDVRERIAVVGHGGGLMLAPTHMVEPEVPWENIVAFVDEVKSSLHERGIHEGARSARRI